MVLAGRICSMGEPPDTSVITIDDRVIEYRLERRGAETVLILHGGHMSAQCRFGEESFLDAGYSVLVISRPGYGRTAVGAGPSAPEFAVRLVELCRQLGLSLAAVVGISIGARTALTMAAFYPELVPRVILMCPTSFRLWPDRRGRRIAYLVFRPGLERATWGTLHRLLRKDPEKYLPRIVENLTTLDGEATVRRLGPDTAKIIAFLLRCQSGRGFLVDLRPPTDVSDRVVQPTLVLATRNDGAVSFDHAEHLVATLGQATLVEVDTPTHLLWLGEGSDQTAVAINSFIGR
jgi:pimeloyl-ACP methyl ester carboxylesterase